MVARPAGTPRARASPAMAMKRLDFLSSLHPCQIQIQISRVGRADSQCLGFGIHPFQGFPGRGSLPACHARLPALPSSHRTCLRFPVSGVPRYLCLGHAQGVVGSCLAVRLSFCLRRESFGGRCRVSVIRVSPRSGPPFLLHKHVSGRAPSLHGHYPASSLRCAPPTPDQGR